MSLDAKVATNISTKMTSAVDRAHFIKLKSYLKMFWHMPRLFNLMFKQDTQAKLKFSLKASLPPGTNRSRVWQKCGWLIASKNNSRSRYLSQPFLGFRLIYLRSCLSHEYFRTLAIASWNFIAHSRERQCGLLCLRAVSGKCRKNVLIFMDTGKKNFQAGKEYVL